MTTTTNQLPDIESLPYRGTFLVDLTTMARRDLMRVMRQPEALTFSLTMGIFFLLLFYYVFGGVIEAGAGIDYIQFLVPGVLVITALNGSTQTGSGLALDLSEGVTDRFRSLPMNQLAVVAGRTVADGIRNLAGLALLAGFGYVLGFRFDSLAGAIGAVLIAALIGYGFSWINAAIGAKVQNPEIVSMLTMFWLFPLMFASNVFTPTDAMPSWFRVFADNQPISVATDAVRSLSDGTASATAVVLTILWSSALVLGFGASAVRSYRASS